jgi:hypothetical protein
MRLVTVIALALAIVVVAWSLFGGSARRISSIEPPQPVGDEPAPPPRSDSRTITPRAFAEEAGVSDAPADTVQIRVIDGDSGKPLEHYGVRCFPASAKGWRTHGDNLRLRDSGRHQDGILELRCPSLERQLLIVEPEGKEWSPSVGVDFEMTGSGAPRQEITVWRNVTKTVRVRNQSGAPIAKSKLQLLRLRSDEPIDEETRAFDTRGLYEVNGGALLIAAGETRVEGTVELSGPPRETLVLRALGPHVPLVRKIDFGAAPNPIELVVGAGATFAGSVRPPELIAQLGTEPTPRRGKGLERGSFSGVFLRRKDRTPRDFPIGDAAAPIGADGTFRIEGAPAGTWEVHLRYADPMGSTWHIGSHCLGTVELADGQERRESYELSHLLRAGIEGTVTLDGQPLEEGSVTLEGETVGPDGEPRKMRAQGAKVESGGKFRLSFWPAEYRLVVWLGKGGRLHGDELFRVGPGEILTKRFDLRSSLLKLRVVASDGATPLEGIQLQLQVPKCAWTVYSKSTDADGQVEVVGLPEGEIPILAWPKALSTNEAQVALAKKRKGPIDDARVRVATVGVKPPETRLTVVMPASSGY